MSDTNTSEFTRPVPFMDMIKTSAQPLLDQFAMGLSLLCAVHCLALPVLLIVFPSLMASWHIDDHFFHEMLLWVAIPASVIAIFLGCKQHKDWQVLILGGVGIVSLTITALFGHDLFGETGEKLATLSAAAVLAYAHWKNYNHCRRDSCKH